jgi:hypothetical protein
MVKSLEQQAADNGGSFEIDLNDPAGAIEWCPMFVTPAVIEKLDEIAGRLGITADEVLILAIQHYDEDTQEKEKKDGKPEVLPRLSGGC